MMKHFLIELIDPNNYDNLLNIVISIIKYMKMIEYIYLFKNFILFLLSVI